VTTTRYSSGIYVREGKPVNADTETVVLNERRMKIIRMLADGLQVKEIAWIENRSKRAVQYIIEDIYKRLRVSCRVQLVRLAIRKGWVKA
jgi:DNA-binding NarL/FixJ family response regulator